MIEMKKFTFFAMSGFTFLGIWWMCDALGVIYRLQLMVGSTPA